jgi:hypothetical protein
VGAEGVVGPLPVLEFLVELGDLERAGGDLIEFLPVRRLGAFDRAVEFGRAGRQDKELSAARRASVFQGGGQFAAASDLQGARADLHKLSRVSMRSPQRLPGRQSRHFVE